MDTDCYILLNSLKILIFFPLVSFETEKLLKINFLKLNNELSTLILLIKLLSLIKNYYSLIYMVLFYLKYFCLLVKFHFAFSLSTKKSSVY
jgi:hypothetical protein